MSHLAVSEEMTMLLQSNLIENEQSLQALTDAMIAWDYLVGERQLSHEVLRHAHELLMDSRDTISDKWKGFYRTIPVYIAGTPAPPATGITASLDRLFPQLNGARLAPRSDEGRSIYARRLHVEFEHIHPFVDGNGRMGRMIYNWHRLKLELPIHIIDVADRASYYEWFKKEEAYDDKHKESTS